MDHNAYWYPSPCVTETSLEISPPITMTIPMLLRVHCNTLRRHFWSQQQSTEVKAGTSLSGWGERVYKTERDQPPRRGKTLGPWPARSATWTCLIPAINSLIYWHQKETRKWAVSRKTRKEPGTCGQLPPSPVAHITQFPHWSLPLSFATEKNDEEASGEQ